MLVKGATDGRDLTIFWALRQLDNPQVIEERDMYNFLVFIMITNECN